MTGSHEDSEDCPEVEEYEGYELEQWEYQQDFSLQLQDFESCEQLSSSPSMCQTEISLLEFRIGHKKH